jgi:hypothetical protein
VDNLNKKKKNYRIFQSFNLQNAMLQEHLNHRLFPIEIIQLVLQRQLRLQNKKNKDDQFK